MLYLTQSLAGLLAAVFAILVATGCIRLWTVYLLALALGVALGGVIAAAIGVALCFAVNALSFAAVLISLAAMRGSELFPAPQLPRRKRQVRAGLCYERSTPDLLIPLIMIAVIGTLAREFQVSCRSWRTRCSAAGPPPTASWPRRWVSARSPAHADLRDPGPARTGPHRPAPAGQS